MTDRGSILVVEDDTDIGDLLVTVLTEEGYAVRCVATGSDALAALAKCVDLALIDLHLPGMTGWELLDAVRLQGINVPIVIMTATTLRGDELAAVRGHTLLPKPFDLDDLLTCVAQHIRRSSTG